MLRKVPGQHDAASLRSRIGIGGKFWRMNSVYRRDIDNPRRNGGGSCGAQKRQQPLREKEWRFHVEIDHLVPAGLWVVVDRRAPRGPSIIDQYVEPLLRRSDQTGDTLDTVLCAKVAGNGDAFAEFRQLGSRTLAVLRFARGDIDAGDRKSTRLNSSH